MTNSSSFTPDWASPPGDTIQDALDERDIGPAELAELSGLTEDEVSGLLTGDQPLTHHIALRLEAALGEPVGFWLRREADYREGQSL